MRRFFINSFEWGFSFLALSQLIITLSLSECDLLKAACWALEHTRRASTLTKSICFWNSWFTMFPVLTKLEIIFSTLKVGPYKSLRHPSLAFTLIRNIVCQFFRKAQDSALTFRSLWCMWLMTCWLVYAFTLTISQTGITAEGTTQKDGYAVVLNLFLLSLEKKIFFVISYLFYLFYVILRFLLYF